MKITIDSIKKTALLAGGLFLSVLSVNADDVQKSIDFNYLRTPEAAAFKKYGEESVNEYTGTADISVPLYTIKCKDIEIPLVLRYDASGIKVEQEASWVGLGWNLMVGGCINYVCAGGNDMYGASNIPTKTWTEYLTSEFSPWSASAAIYGGVLNRNVNQPITRSRTKYYTYNSNDTFNWMNKLPFHYYLEPKYIDIFSDGWGMKQYLEWGYGERDFYSVNVMGKSFMFFVDPATLSIFNIGKAGEEFVVTPDFSRSDTNPGIGNIPDVGTWKITDSDGYIYYFAVKDTYMWDSRTGHKYSTCWYLTTIQSPSGEKVQFTYSEFNKDPRQTNVESFKMPIEHDGGTWCCGKLCDEMKGSGDHPIAQNENSNMKMTTHYLSEISTKNQTVTFSTSESSLNSGKKLNSIKVKSYDGTTIKTINFSYGSFAPSKVGGNYAPNDQSIKSQYRLKLCDVKEIASGETLTTSFSYNENVNLPSKRSFAQDYWGYYNGASNTTLLPTPNTFMSSVHDEKEIQKLGRFGLKGANRNSNGNNMQAAVLKKIIYPTGGYTTYEYEPNSCFIDNKTYTVGGLRVTRINNFDNNGDQINYIKYSYSGGVLLNYIETIDHANMYNFKPQTYNGIIADQTHYIEMYTITPGHPRMPAFFAACNPGIVGYSNVTKSKYNAKNQKLEKKIVTTYYNDAPRNEYNLHWYYNFNNGHVLKQQIYNGDKLAAVIENTYGTTTVDHYFTNIIATPKNLNSTADMHPTYKESQTIYNRNGGYTYQTEIYPVGNSTSGVFDVLRYPYLLSRCELEYTTTTEYCPNNNTIITTKKYSYNDKNHQVAQIDEYRSDNVKNAKNYISLTNKFNRTKIKYTVDDSKHTSIVNKRHRLNGVVETQKILVENGKENRISTQRTDYNDGTFVFALPNSSSTSVGNAPLETRATYTYDGDCNVRSVKIDGKETVYIWSYNSQYPIAKIEGLTFDKILSAIGQIEDSQYPEEMPITERGRTEISKIMRETDTKKISTFITTIRKKVSELGGYITTYTYKPLVGITSETLPNGMKTTYKYDGFGRLTQVLDQSGSVISTNSYNYKK